MEVDPTLLPSKLIHVSTTAEDLARAAAWLEQGGLVAVPTETVYGLAARADSSAAIAGIYAAKGRPAHNPLIVHVRDVEAAKQLVLAWPAQAEDLAQQFWPGPLTLVLPVRPGAVADGVTAGQARVAIRVPAHPVMRALLERCPFPLAAPSANRSEHLSPTRPEHVVQSLGDRAQMLIEAGPCAWGIESTIVAPGMDSPGMDSPGKSAQPARLLRYGAIPVQELEALVGALDCAAVSNPAAGKTDAAQPLQSLEAPALEAPGMMLRHYAPKVPLRVLSTAAMRIALAESQARGRLVGCLLLDADRSGSTPPPVACAALCVHMSGLPTQYGRDLFHRLYELEAAACVEILIEQPPKTPGWEAIHDRLRRASA